MRIATVLALVFVLAGLLPDSALAQVAEAAPTPPPATSASLAESLKGEALAAYNSAKLLFGDGDAAGAMAKFRRAHELSNDPRLLWNMAVCEKELRHYASAARLVTRYLVDGGDRLSEGNRQSARETRDALRSFYSDLTLRGLPTGAVVTVDGVNVGTAPLDGPVPVDLGRRQIRVELTNFEPFERVLDVPGATPVALDVSLVPVQRTGSLSVTSSGPQDTIAIDGKVVGSAPWQGALGPGEHVVRVTAAGKKPYETRVQISPKGSRSLQVTLQDDTKGMPLWPWVVGGAVLVGAGIGGYFLLKPEPQPGAAPQGKLGTIYLPAAVR